MKKLILLLAMILLPMVASAETVEINGIWYNLVLKVKEAEVTQNPNYYSGSIEIPSSVNYDGVVYSVTSIGDEAFSGCEGLNNVTIPNSITSIGGGAFYFCSKLSSIVIPNSVKTMGGNVFGYCTSLVQITLSDNLTKINNYTFSYCDALTNITLPNNVNEIGIRAFESCSKLKNIKLSNNLTSIGESSFQFCRSLDNVVIPSSVTIINKEAFFECSGLTNITIPNSVTTIGNSAFFGCSSLTDVTIPNSVTTIGSSAFSGCSSLINIIIPHSITAINSYTFSGCSGLTSVIIPNNVTTVGEYAFRDCSSLTSITIGSGIKKIDNEAFASCKELADVYCYAINVPNTKNNSFNNSYIDYATLHVPSASVNAYKAAAPWKNFKNIVSLEGGDTPEPSKCATPTISYTNGTLTFNCDTEGAECQYTISDNDIKSGVGNKVQLAVTYNISVYATKTGYDNSDIATATLCWIDQKPATEGITDGIANVPARALLIKNNGGQLTVEGAADGEDISVYTVNGMQSGSAISQNGAASIDTNLQAGSIAIVKIGDKSVKVVIK